MKASAQVLAKMTTRNTVALATIGMFLYTVFYVVTEQPQLLENPFVTYILGSFSTAVVMIYVFLFRVAGPTGLTAPTTLDRPPTI